MADFTLHPQLQADTIAVAELPLSAVLLMRDANYPWLILVPRRVGAVELIDLAAEDRALLTEEIARASLALRAVCAPDKLNVAALGNMVSQFHVHVIGRRRVDPAWPKPVWGAHPAKPYAPGAAETLAATLAAKLR